MVDPIGITGTTLAVATLLYSTCRTISDIIRSYEHAPKEYKDLARELNALQNTLKSLQTSLQGTSDTSLSPEQRESLKDLDLPLTNCNKVCEDFKQKLSSMRSNSTEDHTAVWDRFRLHFNKSDVKFLREKLNTAQATVQVALSVSTLLVPLSF
jgi:DNA repair ATPase RecN